MLITAYNEEKNIARKIENCLEIRYPSDLLEIIIVSDGSTDATEEIVRSHADRGVRLMAMPTRSGKDYSQGQGVAMAEGDIIVLTDTTTFLKEDAIEKIVRGFGDPKIGCISGVDEITDSDSGGSGEGAYVRYEMSLRSLEDRVNSLVVVSGCFFAVRRELCREWHEDLTSDFYLPLIARMKGYRVTLDKDAVGYYGVAVSPQKEFSRKVRTVVNGLRVLFRFGKIMNPFRYGLYSLQMFSHKLLRWLVPFLMVLVAVTNIALLNHGSVYQIVLVGQILFYFLALVALLITAARDIAIFKIPFFFIMVNLAAMIAWFKVMAGEKYRVWEPTTR